MGMTSGKRPVCMPPKQQPSASGPAVESLFPDHRNPARFGLSTGRVRQGHSEQGKLSFFLFSFAVSEKKASTFQQQTPMPSHSHKVTLAHYSMRTRTKSKDERHRVVP